MEGAIADEDNDLLELESQRDDAEGDDTEEDDDNTGAGGETKTTTLDHLVLV